MLRVHANQVMLQSGLHGLQVTWNIYLDNIYMHVDTLHLLGSQIKQVLVPFTHTFTHGHFSSNHLSCDRTMYLRTAFMWEL